MPSALLTHRTARRHECAARHSLVLLPRAASNMRHPLMQSPPAEELPIAHQQHQSGATLQLPGAPSSALLKAPAPAQQRLWPPWRQL